MCRSGTNNSRPMDAFKSALNPFTLKNAETNLPSHDMIHFRSADALVRLAGLGCLIHSTHLRTSLAIDVK